MRMILRDMRAGVHGATVLIGDCKAVKDIVTKLGSTQRTRRFERTTLIVKRLFMLRVVQPVLIRTDDMIGDIFTKALPREKFDKCRGFMLNQDCGSNTIGALSAKARSLWKQLRLV